MGDSVSSLACPDVSKKELKAKFSSFECPVTEDAPTVIDYTSLSIPGSVHRFFDLKCGKGIVVEQGLDGVVEEARLVREVGHRYSKYYRRADVVNPTTRYPFHLKYHEWISAVMAYHWSTHLGDGRYVLSGWKPVFSLIDLKNETFHNYRFRSNCRTLQSAHVHWDETERCLYFCQYDVKGMFEAYYVDSGHQSLCQVCKYNIDTESVQVIWQGRMDGFIDDVRINETREYLVACSFTPGYGGQVGNSRNLILNLKTGEHWYTDEIATPAHCDFDVIDPDVVYFSEHNFSTQEVDGIGLAEHLVTKITNRRVKVGIVAPIGPASIYKYKLNGNRSEVICATSTNDLNRSVSNWNFKYRDRHLVCAPSGDPMSICLFDADDLSLYRAHAIPEPIFTLIPSRNGEHIYAIAAKSKNMYIFETESGDVLDRWNPNTYKYLHHSFHIGRVDDLEL